MTALKDSLIKVCSFCQREFATHYNRAQFCSKSCATTLHNSQRCYLKKTPIERFTKLMIPEPMSGCWIWLGGVDGNNYGHFHDGESLRLAHRWSYEFYIGKISEGLQIDHLCRNRSCVNPYHMEPVTPAINTQRGISVTKVVCKYGHPYTEANTYRRRDNGNRMCRECGRINSRKYYSERKEKTQCNY